MSLAGMAKASSARLPSCRRRWCRPGASFPNRFAGLLRQVPFVFPLACPNARLQPVYVEDVVQAFVSALDRQATFGQRYNLCGPQVYSLREIVTWLGPHR